MPTPYKSVLLFGAPGVGKGTQGKMLGALPGFIHLSTGDVFRSLDKTSPEGKQFLEYSTRGELVPDSLTIQLWQADVARRIQAGRYRPDADVLVLDGIPRNVAQARAMKPLLDVLAIVHLVPPNIDEMVMRMKKRATQENRPDDADEAVIRRRFMVYDQETAPVLSQFEPRLIHRVDAMGTPQQVLDRITALLKPLR